MRVSRVVVSVTLPALLVGVVGLAGVSGPAQAAPTTPAADTRAAAGRVPAGSLLAELKVRAETPAGYARSKFPQWADADRDGCDTREEVLLAEARTEPSRGAGCRLTGGRWVSRYDGVTVRSSSRLDIDHLVPLYEAWQSGAKRWTKGTRKAFANDLRYGPSLIAVTASTNRSKGDREPQSWMPPKRSYACTYVAQWVAVKWRWRLAVNGAEKTFLSRTLAACGSPTVAKPARATVRTASGGSGGAVGGGGTVREYANCTALHVDYPHGVGRPGAADSSSGTPVTDFYVSGPLYEANAKSDRDKDGVACEA